jgi:phospholipase C
MTRSAAGAAGLFLSSCFSDRVSTSPTPRPTYGIAPSAVATRWPIKRVVYLMLENRSFDNMFGRFPGANGTSVGVQRGREVPLIDTPEWLPRDIAHRLDDWEANFNDGRMDGFGVGDLGGFYAYSQFDPHEIPNYYSWAEEFVLSDHMFASSPGPSFPQHLYFIAGQAGGAFDTPENISTKTLNNGKIFKSWGCDAVGDDVYVDVVDADGNHSRQPPCFRFQTVGEQLSERNIDWASYSAEPLQAGYVWQSYSAIDDVFHDEELWDEHIWPVEDLLRDIEANALPAVTWVTPLFQLSDHPPFSTKHAHNWVTDIVNGIMRSDMWNDVAIFITWDEWGGFYDHVVPPVLDGVRLGFRVPMLVISPYAKRGYVDDALTEFSAPLRFVADNWGLPYLTPRIAGSHNMEHVFDFERPPRQPSIHPRIRATNRFWDLPETFPGWPPGVDPQSPRITPP